MRRVLPLVFGIIFLCLAIPAAAESPGSCQASYGIQIVGPRHVREGQEVKFRLRIYNWSPCPTENLTLTYYTPLIITPMVFEPSQNVVAYQELLTIIWLFLSAPAHGSLEIIETAQITETASMNAVLRACLTSVNGPAVCTDHHVAVNPPFPQGVDAEE